MITAINNSKSNALTTSHVDASEPRASKSSRSGNIRNVRFEESPVAEDTAKEISEISATGTDKSNATKCASDKLSKSHSALSGRTASTVNDTPTRPDLPDFPEQSELLEIVMPVNRLQRQSIDALAITNTPRPQADTEKPLLGSEALIEAPVEALGKAPAEAPIEESPIADTLRPQADTEKPLLVSDDPHVAAKIHRKSDNTKLLISMIIEAIVAASVLGAGLSQGGKIGDSADEDYGNADNADAQATQLQASEQSVIDTAGKDAYAAVTDALTAEAFADPANQKMATNPETPGVEPTGELRDDVTQQIATEAQAAQQTAEVKAQQAVETKVTQLQSYAEAQRTQADALNKEAKVVSGSTGGTGAGLVLAAIGSATKFTVNRRHNHQAKNNLMEINRSGEYDARYKGDGIPRTVDVKA